MGGGTLERRKEGRRPSGKEGAGPGTAFTLALWGAGRFPHPTQAPSSLRIIMLKKAKKAQPNPSQTKNACVEHLRCSRSFLPSSPMGITVLCSHWTPLQGLVSSLSHSPHLRFRTSSDPHPLCSLLKSRSGLLFPEKAESPDGDSLGFSHLSPNLLSHLVSPSSRLSPWKLRGSSLLSTSPSPALDPSLPAALGTSLH